MIKIINGLQKILMPIANKMNKNKYLKAMRDAFVLALPFTMVGSILTSLVTMPFLDGMISPATLSFVQNFVAPSSIFSSSIIAIFVAAGIGYSLGAHYKVSSLHSAMTSLVTYLMLSPYSVTTVDGAIVMNVIPMGSIGAKAIFTAIIIGIISSELYRIAVQKKITINLPDSVPASIKDSFTAFIPAGFAMIFALITRGIFAATSYGDITTFIFDMFQKPLTGLGTSYIATVIAGVVNNVFWFFGLHGQTLVYSVFRPFWQANSAENIIALQQAAQIPHLVSSTYIGAFVTYGGWISIPLLSALFMFKKRKDWQDVAKVSLAPGIFNIYEPLMFGLPLVLNPFMFIPMVLTPIITTSISWLVMSNGWVPFATGIELPITTPLLFLGVVATNSIRGGLLQLAILPILIGMWYIFLKVADKSEQIENLESNVDVKK